MIIYRRLMSAPEVCDLSDSDRHRLVADCIKKLYGHWQMWLAWITVLACALIGAIVGMYASSLVVGRLVFVVACVTSVYVPYQTAIILGRRDIRAARQAQTANANNPDTLASGKPTRPPPRSS